MGIDKIIPMTLQRSDHRQKAFEGAILALQTPIDRIGYLKGYDNHDFNDDIDAVADAAAADGFPFIYQFSRGFTNEYTQQTAGAVCQTWNYARLLRHIANGNETCMIFWDDRMFTLPFPFINKIVGELQQRGNFYLWQPRCRYTIGRMLLDTKGNYFSPDPPIDWFRIAIEYPELVGKVELPPENYYAFCQTLTSELVENYKSFIDAHYYQGEMGTPIKAYVDKYFKLGMMGLEENMIFSPQGAAWLLREMLNMRALDNKALQKSRIKKYSDKIATLHFEKHQQAHPESTASVGDFMPDWAKDLQRVFPALDCWLYSILDFETPIADGKGIYCPKRVEYAYINDWFPQGSDIDWTVNADWEHKRTLSNQVPFLDIK